MPWHIPHLRLVTVIPLDLSAGLLAGFHTSLFKMRFGLAAPQMPPSPFGLTRILAFGLALATLAFAFNMLTFAQTWFASESDTISRY